MKKLLIILFSILPYLVQGQSSVYKPFPTNYGNWVYQYYNDNGSPSGSYTEYILKGDTSISSTNYSKIFVDGIYAGAIRESNKVVYIIPDSSSGNEYVLYDWNLTQGDTIIKPYGGAVCGGDTVTIYSVDSVLASDGYHRRLHLSSWSIWIEGIGSIAYLLEPAQLLCVSGNDKITCMNNDSSWIYPAGRNKCVVSLREHSENNENLKVFPNPSFGKINITLSNAHINEVTLYDLSGRIALKKESLSSNSLILENLEPGSYILSIVDQNARKTIRKVIISPAGESF